MTRPDLPKRIRWAASVIMAVLLSVLLWLPLMARATVPGTEIVLMLDNSASMAVSAASPLGRIPPNDPERAAVLGSLVIEGLVRSSQDRLGVVAFGSQAADPPRVLLDGPSIRALPYVGGTWFRPALQEARRILAGSEREHRLLIVFTDGQPEDIEDPTESRRILEIEQDESLDTLVLALYGSDLTRRAGEYFLRPMTRSAGDLRFLEGPGHVVSAFTQGYARAIGSRALSGNLGPGGSETVKVPRYAVEVLVMAASVEPGEPFSMSVKGPGGELVPQASGDNGCPPEVRLRSAWSICDEPRRHFQVFRDPKDPEQSASWTLSLPQGAAPVEYGVILRYDLSARLEIAPSARMGQEIPIRASIMSRGQVFDDADFFKSDGFSARVSLHDGVSHTVELPLEYEGKGYFTGRFTPDRPSVGLPGSATVHFSNTWLDLSARKPLQVEDFLELVLRPSPDPLDLGVWRGERGRTSRCGLIDLAGSTNAERIPLKCSVEGLPEGWRGTCLPEPGEQGVEPARWRVCVETPRCCGDAQASNAKVVLEAQGEHYAGQGASVALQYLVRETGLLRCWWPLLVAIASLLLLLAVLYGFIRPRGFDPGSAIRVAGSEAGLARTSALVLRELPGGNRGFYRDARVSLNAAGDFVRAPGAAVLVVQAAGGGLCRFRKAVGMERKNRRSNRWETVPPEDLAMGPVAGQLYRLGSLHVKFE